MTTGTGAAIYGLVHAGGAGWTDPTTLAALGSAVVLWSAFAAVERVVTDPLLRVGLLLERPVAAGSFLMLVATGVMVGGFFLGSFALQRAYDDSAIRVGASFLPVAVAVVVGAHVAGRLLSRLPARAVAAGGLSTAAAGNTVAALTTGAPAMVVGLSVAALGVGATFVTAFGTALADAAPDVSGLRSAIVSTFHELGGAVGVAVLSSIVGAALVASHPAPSAFTGAFTVAAVTAAIAAVLAALLVPPIDHLPVHAGH